MSTNGCRSAAAPAFKAGEHEVRNAHWHHMANADVISMPDKWEYPWFAAWDLAFHTLALSLVDPDFGKQQLDLMLHSRYLHPNGQLPAYEWNFGDVNPPVHAWATIFTYRLEKAAKGQGDIEWLERAFHKLMLNFTWWVNRKDRSGSNVFEGGFLGLDNIGVFDRSAPLPTGGYLEQADGTAWMALFCQNLLEIAVELSETRPAYIGLVEKFVEHALLDYFLDAQCRRWAACGTRRTGSSTMSCGCRTARRSDSRSGPWSGCFRCAPSPFSRASSGRSPPRSTNRLREFLMARPELRAFIHDPVKTRQGWPLDERAAQRRQASPSADADAR